MNASNNAFDKQPVDDGGPAFPGDGTAYGTYIPGMSVHDYFMAHAPETPQRWFMPAMPESLVKPTKPALKTLAQKVEYREWEMDMLAPWQMHHDQLRAFAEAHEAWHEEHSKQRRLQWPAAWADEMLKRRRK